MKAAFMLLAALSLAASPLSGNEIDRTPRISGKIWRQCGLPAGLIRQRCPRRGGPDM